MGSFLCLCSVLERLLEVAHNFSYICKHMFGFFLLPVLPVLREAVGKHEKQKNPNEFLLMYVGNCVGLLYFYCLMSPNAVGCVGGCHPPL